MSEVKTIKGVDEEIWADFKAIAEKEDRKMAEVLADLVKYYKERNIKKNWEEILTVKEPLTEYEAKMVEKRIKEFRKDFKFRETKWD